MDTDKETTDDEETLEEQERVEGKLDHSQELAELEVIFHILILFLTKSKDAYLCFK